MIRVVIADDQVLLRESIAYILDNDEMIRVVGMAGNGSECIDLCERLRPDLVLMDIEMPGMDGVRATGIIKKKYPEIKVVILTTFENDDDIMAAFVDGADGYIVKNISHMDLILTVKCVTAGLTVIDKSVRNIMIERFKTLSGYRHEYRDILSEKDLEIVRLIASGRSNREIATALNYTEGTIKNNVSRILQKLNLSDRMQIAIFAIENGIV